ncbi:oxidoreductase, partial [Micromonospora sp. D75]|nr:oxidoreductase [Micromonospora sp. D75]
AGVPTGAVGLIVEAEQAEQIVAGGEADRVLLGRELLRDPSWPRRAAAQLNATPAWPNQYARAF